MLSQETILLPIYVKLQLGIMIHISRFNFRLQLQDPIQNEMLVIVSNNGKI